MTATDQKGVWTQQIAPGFTMLVDTNSNLVMVTTPDEPINYSCPDGISISDISWIESDIKKRYNL
jgi:hypothetical protein